MSNGLDFNGENSKRENERKKENAMSKKFIR
jgi:hypothetical protein